MNFKEFLNLAESQFKIGDKVDFTQEVKRGPQTTSMRKFQGPAEVIELVKGTLTNPVFLKVKDKNGNVFEFSAKDFEIV